MDILQPQLLWIGKRCYRVNDLANKDFTNQNPRTNEYIEDGLFFFYLIEMTPLSYSIY